MKKLSIFALAAALLAGCTEIPKELSVLTATPARSISYNGMTLAETGETSFNLGRFQNLPRVRSTEDINALDSAIMTYGDIQKRAARKGDWETMMTARHLGLLLVEYRSYVTESSLRSIRSINAGADGYATMTIPAGGYAVLPYKLGKKPVSTRASMENALMQLMEASLSKRFESGSGVHVASNLQQILKTMSDIQQPVVSQSSAGSPTDVFASSIPTLTDMVPMNQPFVVSEAGGKRYVIERTEDAWVVNNPSGIDLKIQIEKLGYAPEFNGYDPERYAAVDLATRIEDQGIMLLANAYKMKIPTGGNCYTSKPGNFFCVGKNYLVGENGSLIETNGNSAAQRPYENKASYKLAIELNGAWRFSEPVFSGFRNSCNNAYKKPITSSKFGNGGELYTISCLDSGGAIRYSRQYYISSDRKRMVQTVGSFLADHKKREEIEKALAPAKMAEGFTQFVPFLGTIDGLAQCAGANTLTQGTYLAFAGSRVRDQARLDSFLGEPDSIGSRTLNCLGSIAIAGDAIKAARWMSGWLNVSPKHGAELSASLKEALASSRMKKVEEISAKFGQDWVSGKNVTDSIDAMKAGNVGAATIKMAETFYAAAQQGNNMTDLAEAAMVARDAF